MNKNIIIAGSVIGVLLVAGAGYLIFRSMNKPASTSSNTASSSNSSTVSSDMIIVTKTSSSLGQYLAEPNGQPLYTYNADTSGVSNCTGSCLASWPAYQATGSTANLPTGVAIIKRTDNGQTQYTYNGLPLYTFVGDNNGQITGNGLQNFAIATPSSSSSNSSSSNQSNSSTGSSNSYSY